MPHFDALPVETEIVVSIGTPKHDRRLSDKILAAFGHAAAEGAPAVAALLRRVLELQLGRWRPRPNHPAYTITTARCFR